MKQSTIDYIRYIFECEIDHLEREGSDDSEEFSKLLEAAQDFEQTLGSSNG